MTDQELIAYLKRQGLDKDVAAADRIEELVKERDFILSNQTYSYLGKNLKRWLARDLEDAKDAAEAKLTKAVEALRCLEIAATGAGVHHPQERKILHEQIALTRAVLAELEGKE